MSVFPIDSLTIAPGVSDGLSARLVEQAGFKAVYASGGAIGTVAICTVTISRLT